MNKFAIPFFKGSLVVVILVGQFFCEHQAQGQVEPSDTIANPSFEESDDQNLPADWFFFPGSQKNFAGSIVEQNVFAGKRAFMIDATLVSANPNAFGNLRQTLSAKPYRGKKVRFRAAVRTAELGESGRAQLWFRVDRPPQDGQSQMGAFDNMQNRPIRNETWQHYEIVARVDDDAEKIMIGLLAFGTAKVWIDDASFEIVEEKTPTTTSRSQSAPGRTASAPPEPFFNHWLWLVLIAILLMAYAGLNWNTASSSTLSSDDPTTTEAGKLRGWRFHFSPKQFAFRFAFVYWLCYSLPMPFAQFGSYVGLNISDPYQSVSDKLVRWTAPNILGIEYTLVPPLGSGDTTYNYVQLFLYFFIALAVAIIWSGIDWRKTDYRWLRDLLRSYVRYVLAMTLLGYGLAKVGFAMNQFPEPGVDQLMKTYGDSSPMNLLWTFMGASRPYTMFAGLGEVLGALLLIWRRTTSLGALVVCGVMTNVVMLNFCYDVPVKQYSFHLLAMAIFLLLPEFGRFANLLFWNRATEPIVLTPPYTNRVTIWIQRLLKAVVIILGIGLPIGMMIQQEIKYQPAELAAPDYFGAYLVEEFSRDGESIPPIADDSTRWKIVSFRRLPWAPGGGAGPTDFVSIRMMNGVPAGGIATVSEGKLTLPAGAVNLPRQLEVQPIDDNHLQLSGTIGEQAIVVKLRRLEREDFLLVNRGFHWINETPYNR